MRFEAEFGSKADFDEIVELFGEPPCNTCLVQAMCKEKRSGEKYSWILMNVCDEMVKWCTTARDNLLRKQIEKLRNDEVYREKMTKSLLEIAKKHPGKK